jgi:hypothetical protein
MARREPGLEALLGLSQVAVGNADCIEIQFAAPLFDLPGQLVPVFRRD